MSCGCNFQTFKCCWKAYGDWWLSSSMIIKQHSQSFNKSILVGRSKFWIFKCYPRVYGQNELMKLDFYLQILDTCYMNLMTHFFLIRNLASLFSNGFKILWWKEVLHKKPPSQWVMASTYDDFINTCVTPWNLIQICWWLRHW
jgi:hypothetical protein